ncbi:hypothetical protein CYMTET_24355 [Cymbomonas tetramitiformis]|uniref:Uncharacterized protein n=1 Tax=Cymbomonas tetramitiformis TaxID=36881 RepID=A0AAE0BQJ0_9CHLO|nr:hypothetical protein CYMTET_49213 [Cymbomonas tetramitiformis]KAK3267065.1 hypothetical protein CYMTET_24355 [Cymbomonas tetramitiformis]
MCVRPAITALGLRHSGTPSLVVREFGEDDVKLGRIVIYLKTQIEYAGLDTSSFDFDDTAKAVLESVNALVYDTLVEVIEPRSAPAEV